MNFFPYVCVAIVCLSSRIASAQNAPPPDDTIPRASFPEEAPSEASQEAAAPITDPGNNPPTQNAVICEPTCSPGYTCARGQCVSICNPLCPDGYRCGPDARCEPLPAPPATASREQVIRDHAAELERQSAYRHDGFYFRVGFTMGYAVDTAKLDGWTTESSGAGGFIDYAIGGTILPGLVLAFAHHTLGVFSSNTTVNGEKLSNNPRALFQVLGPHVNFYPDPRGGLHFAATVGFGSAGITASSRERERELELGFGLAGGAGYDFWVTEQWSLGATGRVMYINGATDEFGEHRAVVPLVALGGVYH